ncbi:MAG: TetR/AcrR family transcriptional regulator [Burkholderiales bacterium]|nr:TetR/AcrR family transcriptional regulator [Burkholderiales bacterium]
MEKQMVEDHRVRVAEERRARMRAHLLECALVVFALRKQDGSLIDTLTSTADVSRGTFYNYFCTHEELLDAVAVEVGREMLHVVDPVVRQLADPDARLATGVLLCLGLARKLPTLASFIIRGGAAALSGNELLHDYLPRDIAAGMEAGQFAGMQPRVAFDLVVGPVMAGLHTLVSTEVDDDFPTMLTQGVLMALGVAPERAHFLARQPLAEIRLPAESLLLRAESRVTNLPHE